MNGKTIKMSSKWRKQNSDSNVAFQKIIDEVFENIGEQCVSVWRFVESVIAKEKSVSEEKNETSE